MKRDSLKSKVKSRKNKKKLYTLYFVLSTALQRIEFLESLKNPFEIWDDGRVYKVIGGFISDEGNIVLLC